MKDSSVLEIAVKELTGAVNDIAHSHNISPALMRYVLGLVETKLSDLVISELVEEVIDLELKVGKTSDNEGIGHIEPLNTDVKRSGSIDDLIADLKSNGVNVEEKAEVTE